MYCICSLIEHEIWTTASSTFCPQDAFNLLLSMLWFSIMYEEEIARPSLSSRVSGIPCFSRPPGKMCTKIPPVSRPVVKFALESLPSPVPFSLSSFNLSNICIIPWSCHSTATLVIGWVGLSYAGKVSKMLPLPCTDIYWFIFCESILVFTFKELPKRSWHTTVPLSVDLNYMWWNGWQPRLWGGVVWLVL